MRRWIIWGTLGVLLVALSGALGFAVYRIAKYPKESVLWIAAQAKADLRHLEDARWLDKNRFVVEGIWFGDYVWADRIEINFPWKTLLWDRTIEEIKIDGPQLWSGHLARAFPKSTETSSDASGSGFNLLIRRLELNRGQIMLEDLIPGKAIPIWVGRSAPLVLNNIDFNGEDSDSANELQMAETPEIILYSSFDAMAPVIGIEKIQFSFTWAGLAKQRIEKIALQNPTIFLGPDLFDFVDAIQPKESKAEATPQVAVKEEGWKLGRFELTNGRLTINAFGQPGVTLPFFFNSAAENIDTNHLEKLSLENAIKLNASTYTFPDIQVTLKGLEGNIAFGLPLKDNSLQGKNVVQTVQAKSIQWKGLEVTDPYFSVTFDRNGIYTQLGGNFYGGNLTASGMVYYDGGFPWSADCYIRDVSMEPVTRELVHEHFNLSGKMNADLSVKAVAKEIQSCSGKVDLLPPGIMEIRSIDKVIEKLPADWNSFKRSGVTVALQTFRTYDYTRGQLTFDYALPTSRALLDFEGKQGKRRFDLRWHQDPIANSKKQEQLKP